MNWIESLQSAIAYMEAHLEENITTEQIARHCGYSQRYLAQGFQIVTGYSFADYIRNRRLYLAGKKLQRPDQKVIDVALQYGYDSADSFSRAFRRFHGFLPSQAGQPDKTLKPFLPLLIQISVRGGEAMEYTIQKLPAFELIGKCLLIPAGANSFQIIPEFWNDFNGKVGQLMDQKDSVNPEAKAVWENRIGEFGLCIDSPEKLEYLIGGRYHGGQIPVGYEVRHIPACTWAQFTSIGPLPDALQSVTRQVFKEWLPQNPDYQLDQDFSIEYYPLADCHTSDYRCQLWIPVKKKEAEEKQD